MRPQRLRLRVVRGPLGRLRGLLCRRRPPGPRSGIWLLHCSAVHTMGMRHVIDVAFIDRRGRVLRVVRLAPWRCALCVGAVSVVETRAGVIDVEHGGIGRVEAAIQDAAGGDVDGYLQRAGH